MQRGLLVHRRRHRRLTPLILADPSAVGRGVVGRALHFSNRVAPGSTIAHAVIATLKPDCGAAMPVRRAQCAQVAAVRGRAARIERRSVGCGLRILARIAVFHGPAGRHFGAAASERDRHNSEQQDFHADANCNPHASRIRGPARGRPSSCSHELSCGCVAVCATRRALLFTVSPACATRSEVATIPQSKVWWAYR
jgi:hypothetical protein